MVKFKTWYMDEAVFDLPTVITMAKRDLERVDFDTLVGTGFSGGIVVPSLAMAMGKKFVLIRKDNDDSHHGPGRLLGELGDRWVFVDDFIATGETRRRVIERVNSALLEGETTTLVGQYMYCTYTGFTPLSPEGEYLS